MTDTTTTSLSDAPQWAWHQITERTCVAFSQGYDLGYAQGWHAAQAQAEQGSVNRQVSRAAVQNISTEIARAKADGREPRLYAEPQREVRSSAHSADGGGAR